MKSKYTLFVALAKTNCKSILGLLKSNIFSVYDPLSAKRIMFN